MMTEEERTSIITTGAQTLEGLQDRLADYFAAHMQAAGWTLRRLYYDDNGTLIEAETNNFAEVWLRGDMMILSNAAFAHHQATDSCRGIKGVSIHEVLVQKSE